MTPEEGPQLTFFQRRVLRSMVRQARRGTGEALSAPDWEAYFAYGAQPRTRLAKSLLRALPSTPRCGYCGAPFAGVGAKLVGPLGYRPSRKNPSICATCVELAPPGGTTVEAGVLFADLRGFSELSESQGAAQAGATLRQFYALAEQVLLPHALVDKVVGDEVMALYLPGLNAATGRSTSESDRRDVATRMLAHAHELLHGAGYGTPQGPALHMGIGLDFGEVFLGNIGDSAIRDFTAVGEVVNTASRLQGQAAGGEVVVSARLAAQLETAPGEPEELYLKGKQEPLAARRIRWFADPA